MATGMLSFQPAVVRAGINAASEDRRSNQARKTSSWWAPLFGFSSEPDGEKGKPAAEGGHKRAKTRFGPGSFTEEKARRLRRMTNDASSFLEDSMYRSAVASRLASDFSDRAAA